MKFTFKTNEPTGRYRSFYRPTYYIKLKRKEVGYIGSDKPHIIRLQIIKKDIMEDGNPNCSWRWMKLKKTFDSIDEAKVFLNEHVDEIVSKFNLYYSEKEE